MDHRLLWPLWRTWQGSEQGWRLADLVEWLAGAEHLPPEVRAGIRLAELVALAVFAA